MEPWQHYVENKLKDGDMFLKEGDYESAIYHYKHAFSKIPGPKDSHGEATEVISAIGDVYLLQDKLEDAEQAFRDVLLFPGGASSPYIRIKRAEVFHKMGDDKAAVVELTVVCFNDGPEVLEDAKNSKPWLDKLLPEVLSQF